MKKAGFVQTSPLFGEVERNVEEAMGLMEALDADIIVLPELFNTGYSFRSCDEALTLAEDAKKGYTVKRLSDFSSSTGRAVVAGIAERSGRRVYNSAVLVTPDGASAVYRKAHLFRKEKEVFTPGDRPFTVHEVAGMRVGMMICFDWLFPEAARTLALKGADIICHPSNLVLPHCPSAMITRCLENRIWAVTANRAGTEDRAGERLVFIGKSQVVSPEGKVLLRAGGEAEASGAVDIDTDLSRNKRITPENDIFADRRPGLYSL